MIRRFNMTPKAQQALWRKIGEAIFIPTQFVVDGTQKDRQGYNISIANDKDEGFPLLCLRSFYAMTQFKNQLNETGKTEPTWEKHCAEGSFAFREILMPNIIKPADKKMFLDIQISFDNTFINKAREWEREMNYDYKNDLAHLCSDFITSGKATGAYDLIETNLTKAKYVSA